MAKLRMPAMLMVSKYNAPSLGVMEAAALMLKEGKEKVFGDSRWAF